MKDMGKQQKVEGKSRRVSRERDRGGEIGKGRVEGER